MTKSCTRCHTIKAFTEFYSDKYHTSGYKSHCKICNIKDTQTYRTQHKEATQLSGSKYNRSVKGKFKILKSKAKTRGLDLTLTALDYELLLRGAICTYCSGPLPEAGSGLDRIDNDQGYVPSNVLPCCQHCNRLKNDFLTVDETKAVVALLKNLRNTTTSPWSKT